MKDFSRMFKNQPAAVKKETKMPDYSMMFKNPAAVGISLSSSDIMEFRRDLSDKVREHVDLVERLVKADSNVVVKAEIVLRDISNEVAEHSEKSTSKWSRFFKTETPTNLDEKVVLTLDKLAVELQHHRKTDPFKLIEVDRLVEQATYLSEQLAKAGKELEAMKVGRTDDIEIDMINCRCATLFTQQQLVAIGAEQVKQLASDIRSRPHQVDDLLSAAIPMCKKLCLDVLAGTKKASDLRKP